MAKQDEQTLSEHDPRDDEIAQLRSQLNSMEAFANVVVEQRNAAQNEAAQLRAQLIQQLKAQGAQ